MTCYGYSLVDECTKETVPTKKQNIELIKRVQSGDKMALSDLCKKNGRMINYIISKNFLHVTTIPEDDLFQQGMLGLIRAAEMFDLSRDLSFSTYAHEWIYNKISRYILNTEKTIRIPIHIYPDLCKVHKYMKSCYEETGSYPAEEHIAEDLGIKLSRVKLILSIKPVSSLDEPLKEDDCKSLIDFLPDAESIEERMVENDLKTQINRYLSRKLNDREKKIITLRYGLNGHTPQTLEKVGKLFGISRERIRQIEKEALKKLQSGTLQEKNIFMEYI